MEPVPGSIVYCQLFYGLDGHSGVYVGDDEIVQLSGDGNIELVDAETFVDGTFISEFWDLAKHIPTPSGSPYRGASLEIPSSHSIYVSSRGSRAVGSDRAASRARSRVGDWVEYDLFHNNCHKLSATCLTGRFKSLDSYDGENPGRQDRFYGVDRLKELGVSSAGSNPALAISQGRKTVLKILRTSKTSYHLSSHVSHDL